MKTSAFALAAGVGAVMATAAEARLGRSLLETTDNDDIEPSQLFMIVCLAIGAFVMLVALLACILVLKRYSGAATTNNTAGPMYASGPGMAAVGGQPMMMQQPMMMPQPMMMQQQPMMMPFMMQPGVKPAAPMPAPLPAGAAGGAAPQVAAQAAPVQLLSQASQARIAGDDRAEVSGVHGDGVSALVNQAQANMAAQQQQGSSHGFQAHQA